MDPIFIDDLLRRSEYHTYAPFEAKSLGPAPPPVRISIDDHLPRCQLRKDHQSSRQVDEPWDSRVCYLAEYLDGSKSENAISIEDPMPHVGDVLKRCLQEVAGNGYVIQQVKKHLDHAVDKSLIEGPEATDEAAQKAQKNDKRKIKHGSMGGRTMMICNIPCRVRHDDLKEAIESFGFGESVSFIHIPCRFGQCDSNLGYCFVHFSKITDAQSFALAFEGYRFTNKGSSKACTVKIADCQGSNGSHRRRARNLRLDRRDL
jgi:hypothetical protein